MSEDKTILSKIASKSIDNYRIVYLGMLLLTLLGIYFYQILPRESKPEVVFPKVKINTNYLGASPSDVELLITNKLEATFSGIDDIEFMTSSSLAGRSEIQIDFFPEVDINEKLNEINQAVASIKDLPEEAEDPLVKVSTTANRPFVVLSLSGDLTPVELKEASDLITNDLLAIKGVNEVRVSGAQTPEIRITVDPARLAQFNLTITDLTGAINSHHKNTPAGDAIMDGRHYFIRVLGAYKSIDEIGKTLISLPNGETRFLKDLATIEDSYKPQTNYSRRAINLGSDNPSMKTAITLSLYRDGGTDIIGPSNKVKEILSKIDNGRFPDGLDVMVIQDDAITVQQDLDDVIGNAISGLLIVVLVLFLFLGLSEALITSLVIPFSLFISFIALNSMGMTFNTMTLLAMIIALGLLVDNAIVVMENVVLYREKGLSRLQAAKKGTAEVAPSILAATLTTIAAFIPIAFMGGRIGLIISVIPITIIFIILASLIVSLTISPMLSSRLLPKKTGPKKSREFSIVKEVIEALLVIGLFMMAFSTNGKPGLLSLIMALVMSLIFVVRVYSRYKKINAFEKISLGYEKQLKKLINKRRNRILVPLITFILFIGVLSTLPLGLLKIELFPIKDESSLYIVISTPEFSTLENTDEVTKQIENIILDLNGIDTIYTEVGVTSARDSEIVLNLKPESERSWTTKEIMPTLLKEFYTIPGIKVSIGTSAGGKSTNSPIQLRLIGNDLEQLATYSSDFVKELSLIDGVGKPVTDLEKGYPEIQVIIKPIIASDLGLDSTIIGNIVKTVISGQYSGTLLNNDGDVPIRFTTNDLKVDSIHDMEKIMIKLKDGSWIPLTQVAYIAETLGLGTIRHNDGVRTVMVYAQLMPNANLKDIVNNFDRVLTSLGTPKGITYEWTGDAADLDSSFNEMSINLALAMLVVFLILAMQFNSLSQPMVILLSVPMAIIGVFLGLILTNNNFGLYAFMGVIALVGIAVNDAIVLVDTINRNKKNGMSLKEALTDAGHSRFGPVLATSLTTIGGILPLAFKDENFAQLSISLIFGLITSTILTLIVLPIIYHIVEETKIKFKKRIPIFIDEEKVL
ncbi:efflux RND transporter permease subunit [Thiospirochaeta perfilievii]|uniref:Efflux RND transporter permease subunit n=1 Tax=Thiospirochaeta perfilievii TaxID=252967 RepID=A0A5C1Q7U8_9SPIO|nr:efflux RND transporter permease subunit [Thiospirochaeta perfilievii]QEN03388.1 efflux RND transporter permease subunit [Thiospirochaeta perfilievii]